MAQPVYLTPAGSLGIIPENEFFQVPILAYDPDDPDNASAVYYRMVAGSLPDGIQCTKTGLIIGTPKAIASLQGVPKEVATNVTSKFVVRAYTEREVDGVEIVDRVRDRTFSLTVTGNDAPVWETPSGSLGYYFDCDPVEIQLELSDPDPDENIQVRVAGGEFPPGLTVSNTGLISGVLEPLTGPPDTAVPGWDRTNFDVWSFDYTLRSLSKNYQFTLEITDGKESNLRTFEIYVFSKDSMSADTESFTADNSLLTADISTTRTPYITTPPGDLGRVRHDNWFAYKFNAEDCDGDPIEYSITTGSALGFDADGSLFDETGLGFDRGGFSLPPGLSIDPDTGWFYGYIPSQGVTETEYRFAIRVRKRDNPTIISDFYYFTITIVGDIENEVTWLTDSDLGTINNGSISNLTISATTTTGRNISYRLKQGEYDYGVGGLGVYNKLPQGLTLLPSGDISGRVSFNTFTLDGGTTTFDEVLKTRLIVDPTTFDREYNFTVEAYSSDGLISVFKTFKIYVDRKFQQPHVGLYVKAMPPESDRAILKEILDNQDIIPVELLYKPTDPNFGRATSVKYVHAYGLASSSMEDWVASLDRNHYHKNVVLGELKTARALDANDNVIYEVVYSEIQDNLVNNNKVSVSSSVKLKYPEQAGTNTVYPNSLDNMRDQIVTTVGSLTPGLPGWMTSKQADGNILGFVPAWVIAYTKPGKSRELAYYINKQFRTRLNTIDFRIDRYELEGQPTRWWTAYNDSTDVGSWAEAKQTTFDRVPLPETTFDGGSVRFVRPSDQYEYTDKYDKYLVFPRTNILG